MKNYVLMMMGGSGTRLGSDIPKQYIEVSGKPIFAHIACKYGELDFIDGIVIVSNAAWIDFVEECIDKYSMKKVLGVVKGGDSRSESVDCGLNELHKFVGRKDIILIHDATHPYVDVEGTKKIISGVKETGGATLGGAEFDTMYRMDANDVIREVIPREEVVSGASPEAFEFGIIYDIYKNTPTETLQRMTSAGALALKNGIKMKVIKSDCLNLKVTYPGDLKLFELLVDNYFFAKQYNV